jgi:carboxylesterase type B
MNAFFAQSIFDLHESDCSLDSRNLPLLNVKTSLFLLPGVLSATQWGPACPQTCELPPHTCPDTTSEDCLTLNVYAPLAPHDAPWPVMFFIHGGNFKQGFGGGPLYDSSTIANSTNTIYVTVNYRIGALSTMLGTDVKTGEVVPGNLAITDQRLALQWVHDNIAAFGGDPTRLTIFGQSAGAVRYRTFVP